MTALLTLAGFKGANLRMEPRFLPDGVGVASLNQRPPERGDFRPWRLPLAVSPSPTIPAGQKTLYRMDRDTPSASLYWLSLAGVGHFMRIFGGADTTERTAYTQAGSTPKWTDNIMALAGAPYPSANRELAVPAPTIAPSVTLTTDGATGDARQLYYVYTRVNDIGWESAPSPPFLAPAAKPGAILALSYSEPVPAGNYGVNRVRWYRQQVAGNTAEYYFLREYLIGAGGQQDDARALGEQLGTEGWLAAPTDGTWLTECWNGFAAMLSGKTVRFCAPNSVYAWPLEFEYELAARPVAMARIGQKLVVLTTDGAEVFVGDHPSAMDQKPIDMPAIVSERGLVIGDTFIIYPAADGLWYYGTDGRRNLTGGAMLAEHWAALVPSSMAGYLYELTGEDGTRRPLWIGFYNDGALKGLVVDPANGLGVYFLSQGYTSGYYDPLLRKLFVLDGATLKEWDAGANMTATFRTGVARKTAEQHAEWLELLADGSVAAKVWVDGTLRYDHAITTGQHRPHEGTDGREWQAEISSDAAVQGLVIE